MSNSSTARLSLVKPNPGTGQPVNPAIHLNGNWDILDDVVGIKVVANSSSRPNPAFNGQIIREADSGRVYFYNGSEWQELYTKNTPWTAFTPTWTATTTNPVLTNGTIEGRYMVVGKMLTYVGRILMGSSTTYGSGGWRISLPVNAAQSNLSAGSAILYDASTAANQVPGVCWTVSNSLLGINATGGGVSASVPFTWASTDQLRWAITYEIA